MNIKTFKVERLRLKVFLAIVISTFNFSEWIPLGQLFRMDPFGTTFNNLLWAQSIKEEEDYSLARGLFEQGLHDLALTRLQAFKNSYPDSKLMDDVEFLLGECKFFGKLNFKEAIFHYERTRGKKYQDVSLLRIGQCYFNLNDYDKATLNFQKVVADSPKGKWADLALYFLGEIRYKKGDYQGAIDIYSVVVKEYPASQCLDQVYYSLGYSYYKKGELDKAIQNFQKVVTQYRESPLVRDAKILLAQSLQSTGDYGRAIQFYKEALDEYPSEKSERDLVLYQTGNTYLNLKDYANAETYFSGVVSEYPKSEFAPLAIKALADCYYKSDNFPTALEFYQKFLSAYPVHELITEIKYWIAATLNRMEKNEEAISAYRQFIEEYRGKGIADELVLDSWLQIGEILYKKKEFLQARNAFSEALQAPLRFSEIRENAMLGIGDCLASEKNYKDAIGFYEKIVKGAGGESVVLQAKFQMAYSYYKQNDFDRAIPLFQNIVDKGGGDVRANSLYWLGWSYFKMSKFSDAEKVFTRLVTEHPSSHWKVDALYRAGDSLYNQGKYKEARSLYQRVLASGELQPESLFAVASSYYLEGEKKVAVKTFQELIDKYPRENLSVEASFKIAEFYVQDGKPNDAIKYYRFIIENFSDNELALQARMATGDSLFALGKYADAIGSYQEIINKYKACPDERSDIGNKRSKMESEYKIGNCYFQMGDVKKANSIYQSFVEKYPESDFLPEICYRIGLIYFNQEQYKEALPYFRKSVYFSSKRSDLGAQSQCRTGDCLFNLGNYEESVSEYLKVIVLYSMAVELHSEAQYKIGMSLLMGGKKDDSKSSFLRVIEKYPASKWASMAKEQLAKIQ